MRMVFHGSGQPIAMQREYRIHRAKIGYMRATYRRSRVIAIIFDHTAAHAAAKGGS